MPNQTNWASKSDREIADAIRLHHTNVVELKSMMADLEARLSEARLAHFEANKEQETLLGLLANAGIKVKLEADPFSPDGLKVLLARPHNPDQPEQSETIILRHKTGLNGQTTCKTKFAQNIYDETCDKCKKIKIIIELRRRNTKRGATPQEEAVALRKADLLIAKYGIKKGEIIDRLFGEVVIPQATYQVDPQKAQEAAWQEQMARDATARAIRQAQATQYPAHDPFATAPPPRGSRMRANNPRPRATGKKWKPGDPPFTMD